MKAYGDVRYPNVDSLIERFVKAGFDEANIVEALDLQGDIIGQEKVKAAISKHKGEEE